jgi:hypothetical protein
MRHQHKKIQKVSANHGKGLFEQSSQHVLSWTPIADGLMPEEAAINTWHPALGKTPNWHGLPTAKC